MRGWVFGLILAGWGTITCAAAAERTTDPRSALPEEARALLRTLPGEVISLDLVLGLSVRHSDSFRAVAAGELAIPVAELRGGSLFDSRLVAGVTRTDNQNEPDNPFSPNRIVGTQASLKASRYFSSGTAAEVELTHGYQELNFDPVAGVPPISYFQTRGGLTLSQNLWQDAFGYGARRTERAGRIRTEAARAAQEESVEEWTLSLVQAFYATWLGQTQARLAESSLQRRRKLFDITKIKQRRGTAENPDVLHVRSALLQTEAELAAARQTLADRWRELVTTLKLPEAWSAIDPLLIPMELDEPVSEALAACRAVEPPRASATARRAELEAQAAKLDYERAKNAAMPDLELRGTYFANDVDPLEWRPTFRGTFRRDNPAWTLGVQLAIPLSGDAEEAEALAAASAGLRAEAEASREKTALRVRWTNLCADLRRLDASTRLLKEAYESQEKRVVAEENRFQIGRSTTLQMIQSGDDATLAEADYRRLETEKRLAAWKVRRLNGGYAPYFEVVARKLEAKTGR